MPRLRSDSFRLLVTACLLLTSASTGAHTAAAEEVAASGGRDLQLEVIVNGTPSGFIAAFHETGDGRLTIEAEQLHNCGLDPAPDAVLPDGRIDIALLPGVSYQFNEALQTVAFKTELAALAPQELGVEILTGGAEPAHVDSSLGGLVNYTLYASTSAEDLGDPWSFSGISGSFEGRLFGPLGLVTSSQVLTVSPNELYSTARLDTTWSYSDPGSMMSYRAGDVITGGLGWTRPVRLGGIQIQRNFGLRPDLVTMPLPELSGSAAVPSTVEVYVDNTRRLSQEVEAGPFSISDVPVFTGNATARLVVRDALGRESVSETPFFASSALLAQDLFDYSAEAGFARRFYGTESFSYDERLMATATARYGLTDWLTLEGHAEGGADFWNAGVGTTIGLGGFGIGTVSGAASSNQGNGYLASASLETEIWGLQWRASTQRTLGDYADIASVTADMTVTGSIAGNRSGAPPRALDQVGVSVPLDFDTTVLNLNFTHLETNAQEHSRILGITASRPIGERGNAFVTAYTDLARSDAFGIFAGLSWSFGNNSAVSSGIQQDADGTSFVSEASGRRAFRDGDLEWRVSDAEGSRRSRGASAAYSGSAGRVEAHVEHGRDMMSVRGQVDGAVIVAGGDVFLSDRVDDAFAVIDVGVPDVEIQFENRPIGKTNRHGKKLVQDLRAYETNRISIDPATLPMHTAVETLSETAVPHHKSGVTVGFAVTVHDRPLTISLRHSDGTFVAPGSIIVAGQAGETFLVGYDGQAYLTGISGRARFTIDGNDKGCSLELDLDKVQDRDRIMEATCTDDSA